jgi:hypothetical protein
MTTYHYGAKDKQHIIDEATIVGRALGTGKAGKAIELMLETAAAETQLGTYSDRSMQNGHGLCQIDNIAIIDLKQRTRKRHKEKIEFYLGHDFETLTQYDIQTQPRVAFIFCRLHYILVPEWIPETLFERAKYWKKYYNTEAGKGTPKHFITSAQTHLYQDETA